MIFGIVVFPMPWFRQGKTQEFVDKFKAGPRTLEHCDAPYLPEGPNLRKIKRSIGQNRSKIQILCIFDLFLTYLDTEYDRATVPPYNGNDPCPRLVV